jgi:hypothetical protein
MISLYIYLYFKLFKVQSSYSKCPVFLSHIFLKTLIILKINFTIIKNNVKLDTHRLGFKIFRSSKFKI